MTNRQITITSSARNAVILSITISLVFAGVWSMQDSFLANAAKPQSNGAGKDVIASSNGFPSGKHFNLIIHGKSSYDSCGGAGGNSVFTPEYSPAGDQTLQYYANKKAHSFTLNVRDPCTEGFDGDPAQVQLPTESEDGTPLADGFWVFARVHGTPDNGKGGGDSNIVLKPDPKIEACDLKDEEEDPTSPTASDCVDSSGQHDVVELGFVTKNGVYKCEEPDTIDCDEKLYRIDDTTSGKGPKKALDITPLFRWSGIACEDTFPDGELTILDFDTNGDGVIGDLVVLDGEGAVTQDHIDDAEIAVYGAVANRIIDTDDEFDALLVILSLDETFDACISVNDIWVFDLFDADLVIQNQTLINDGVKNLQIRFYPKETTEFTPAY
jgi:hypothetical protein